MTISSYDKEKEEIVVVLLAATKKKVFMMSDNPYTISLQTFQIMTDFKLK